MGFFNMGAKTPMATTDPAYAKPQNWQDKLALFGATLKDVGAGIDGQPGGAITQQQQILASRGQAAQRQAALQQVGGTITDPQEAAVFHADPETWFKIYGERQKPTTLSKGQASFAGGTKLASLDDYGVDGGFAWNRPVGGALSFGAQRPMNYGEGTAQAAQAETARNNRDQSVIQHGRLTVDQANSLTQRLSYEARKAAGGFGTPGVANPIYGAELPPGARLDP